MILLGRFGWGGVGQKFGPFNNPQSKKSLRWQPLVPRLPVKRDYFGVEESACSAPNWANGSGLQMT